MGKKSSAIQPLWRWHFGTRVGGQSLHQPQPVRCSRQPDCADIEVKEFQNSRGLPNNNSINIIIISLLVSNPGTEISLSLQVSMMQHSSKLFHNHPMKSICVIFLRMKYLLNYSRDSIVETVFTALHENCK